MARNQFSLMSFTRARWRLSLTLLCLFASTFQSSLAQTHIHAGEAPYGAVAPVSSSYNADQRALGSAANHSAPDASISSLDSGSGVLAHSGTSKQQRDHANPARESTACPLCQILMSAGGLPAAPYEVPSRPIGAAPHTDLEQVPACFIAAVSYDWQSRGPPQI